MGNAFHCHHRRLAVSDIAGALFGAVVWLFGATVFFGAFLVLLDIRGRVKSIETLQRN